MKVSVLIVNWNTEGLLKSCLESIKKYVTLLNYEIIVIDNKSSDNSITMVKRDYPDVKIIENELNLGFGRANNKGIEISKGEYIFLLNSDTYLIEDSISELTTYLDKHSDVGVVGCKLLNIDRTLQKSLYRYPSVYRELIAVTLLNRVFTNSKLLGSDNYSGFDYKNTKDVDSVSGAALMIRRKVIEDIGFLDEYFFMYYEETDWCFNAKKNGWRIIYFPNTSIVHIGGASDSNISYKKVDITLESMVYFIIKNQGYIRLHLTILLKILASFTNLTGSIFFYLLNKNVSKKKTLNYIKWNYYHLCWFINPLNLIRTIQLARKNLK